MNITHIQGIFSPEHGGPTYSLANYCRGQCALGHQVSLRVLEGYPHTSAAVRLPPPIDMAVDPVDRPARLGGSTALRNRLRTDPTPDVYHLHGAWLRAMHYGAVEARRRRKPYVVELMGMYEPWPLQQKRLVKKISRLWYQDALLRRAGCLHVNSRNEAQALRQLGFRAPIAVIPVGVDTLTIDKPVATDSGSPFPGLATQPFFLYLARIHSKKGIELLLQAWSASAYEFPAHCLVVAGSGEEEYVARCRRMVADLGLENRCRWLGPVDDVSKRWLFQHADLYVLPSYSENFGNTVAEALAHSTPVLTTSQTPWTNLPAEGCGWIADATVDALRGRLTEALQTGTAERRRMGEIGRRLVEQRYSLASVVSQIDRIYTWLLGAPEPEGILYET